MPLLALRYLYNIIYITDKEIINKITIITLLNKINVNKNGVSQKIANNPQHPYTRLLLDSVPDPKRPIAERIKEGKNPLREIWDPLGKGCVYAQKCSGKFGECSHMNPTIIEVSKNHFIRQFEYV